MLPFWRRWILPPQPGLDDPHTARTVHLLGLFLLAALPIPIVHNAIEGLYYPMTVLVLEAMLTVLVIALNRLGATGSATRLLCLSAWALVGALCLVGDRGTHDEVLLGLPVLLVVSALLVDRRFFIAFTGLILATLVGLHVAEVEGWLVNTMSEFTTYGALVDYMLILLLTALVVWLLSDDLRRALARARRNEAALVTSKAETERHAEALRRSEQHFRTAMKLAAEGVVLGDPDNRITEANGVICDLSGYTRAEIIGRDAAAFFLPEDLQRLPLRWDDLTRGEVITSERRLVHKDGSTRTVETKSQRLPDGTLQCFVRDITKRREMEEQLRQAQKMEAVGTLAGGVAHDFNNLLTAMRGSIRQLEEERGDPRALQDAIDDLRIQADRAAELTAHLLAFARRQPMQKERLDLRDEVARLEPLIRSIAGAQATVVHESAAEPCPVLVDPALLTQMLGNLVLNARDAMPAGGRLEVRTEVCTFAKLPPAARRASGRGAFVCLAVRDDGAGMEPAVQARVFEPFFTTKEPGQGTGLGLPMVLGITEQHGGWVEVDSEPGRGCEVRMFLPYHAGAPEPAVRRVAPSGDGPVRGTERLLFVEDDPSVRRLAATGFRHLGYTVLEAPGGPEALALLNGEEQPIAALVTDMVMPGGMSGLDLALALRSRWPALPVVITSGYSQETIQLGRIADLGIQFIAKPYELPGLARLVRTMIDTPEPAATVETR